MESSKVIAEFLKGVDLESEQVKKIQSDEAVKKIEEILAQESVFAKHGARKRDAGSIMENGLFMAPANKTIQMVQEGESATDLAKYSFRKSIPENAVCVLLQVPVEALRIRADCRNGKPKRSTISFPF